VGDRNHGSLAVPSRNGIITRSDLGLLTAGDHGNCYAGNVFAKSFSLLGFLPTCR
jgi:hypothetical protein